MKKGMLIAFSILLMLALIGGSAYSQTTVTVWVYDELGEEGRPLYEATQEFMEENPDIVINLQNQPHIFGTLRHPLQNPQVSILWYEHI